MITNDKVMNALHHSLRNTAHKLILFMNALHVSVILRFKFEQQMLSQRKHGQKGRKLSSKELLVEGTGATNTWTAPSISRLHETGWWDLIRVLLLVAVSKST